MLTEMVPDEGNTYSFDRCPEYDRYICILLTFGREGIEVDLKINSCIFILEVLKICPRVRNFFLCLENQRNFAPNKGLRGAH